MLDVRSAMSIIDMKHSSGICMIDKDIRIYCFLFALLSLQTDSFTAHHLTEHHSI